MAPKHSLRRVQTTPASLSKAYSQEWPRLLSSKTQPRRVEHSTGGSSLLTIPLTSRSLPYAQNESAYSRGFPSPSVDESGSASTSTLTDASENPPDYMSSPAFLEFVQRRKYGREEDDEAYGPESYNVSPAQDLQWASETTAYASSSTSSTSIKTSKKQARGQPAFRVRKRSISELWHDIPHTPLRDSLSLGPEYRLQLELPATPHAAEIFFHGDISLDGTSDLSNVSVKADDIDASDNDSQAQYLYVDLPALDIDDTKLELTRLAQRRTASVSEIIIDLADIPTYLENEGDNDELPYELTLDMFELDDDRSTSVGSSAELSYGIMHQLVPPPKSNSTSTGLPSWKHKYDPSTTPLQEIQALVPFMRCPTIPPLPAIQVHQAYRQKRVPRKRPIPVPLPDIQALFSHPAKMAVSKRLVTASLQNIGATSYPTRSAASQAPTTEPLQDTQALSFDPPRSASSKEHHPSRTSNNRRKDAKSVTLPDIQWLISCPPENSDTGPNGPRTAPLPDILDLTSSPLKTSSSLGATTPGFVSASPSSTSGKGRTTPVSPPSSTSGSGAMSPPMPEILGPSLKRKDSRKNRTTGGFFSKLSETEFYLKSPGPGNGAFISQSE